MSLHLMGRMRVLGMVGARLGKEPPAPPSFPPSPTRTTTREPGCLPPPPPPSSFLRPFSLSLSLSLSSHLFLPSPPLSLSDLFCSCLPSFFSFSLLTFKKRHHRDCFCNQLLFLPPWGTHRKRVFSRHLYIGLSQE